MSKLVIGLTGPIGSGKDSVGFAAERQFNAKMIAWSDVLYQEVSDAFSVPIEFLQDRNTKEIPSERLTLYRCNDDAFLQLMLSEYGYDLHHTFSSREVLRKWGTEYRRAQDPQYFANKTSENIQKTEADIVLISGTRFENEVDLVYQNNGFLLHVIRPGVEKIKDHASEIDIPIKEGVDRVISNSGTLEMLDETTRELFESLGYKANMQAKRRIN